MHVNVIDVDKKCRTIKPSLRAINPPARIIGQVKLDSVK